MVLRRATQGLKVHSENVAPAENRGAKRPRGDDSGPASKRGAIGLKVQSENIVLPQNLKKVLRENQAADLVKKDILKEISKNDAQPKAAELTIKKPSPAKKAVPPRPKVRKFPMHFVQDSQTEEVLYIRTI